MVTGIPVAEGLGLAGHQRQPSAPLSKSNSLATGLPSGPAAGSVTVPPARHRKKLNQLLLIAVRVVRSSFVGAVCRNFSTRFPVSATLFESFPSPWMSAASGARACSRKSLVDVARASMVCSESKIAFRSSRQPADELLQAHHQVRQLLVAVGQGAHHGGQVLDHAPDDVVPVGEAVGQRAHVREQALHGAALALEDLDDLEGHPVHVRRRQRLQERLEPAEQHGQVEGVGRLRQGDDRALVEGLPARALPLGQRDVALPDQVAVADRRVDRRRQRHVLADLELDVRDRTVVLPGGRVGQADAGHLADADAGDPDLVALDQPGDVGELGPVGQLVAVAGVGDRRDQHVGRQDRDQGEDRQLDQRPGETPQLAPHRSTTLFPRRIGARVAAPRSETSPGSVPVW